MLNRRAGSVPLSAARVCVETKEYTSNDFMISPSHPSQLKTGAAMAVLSGQCNIFGLTAIPNRSLFREKGADPLSCVE